MFELTGDDVAQLGDADLRTLVALLCEAEVESAGHPISAVTAGGEQEASDGGLDVRVTLPGSSSPLDFIPRNESGFQVKVPDMGKAAILKEMRPKGVLRAAIRELAKAKGAYLIVSAKGSTSDSALKRRRDAMREAVLDEPEAANLLLEFYDRGRLATWVRKYPSVIAWVRAKIGRPVRGWRPYESWSAPGQPAAAEYLLDDRVRVFDSRVDQEDGLSPTDGIKRIRETLAQPGSVCRLIGLSGVGKTRLLEALFDPRVGTDPLDTALAFYCDLAEAPEPSPRDLCRQLTETRKRAIVLVDNCPPETHRALGLIVAASGSRTSLLTVEYDVRDDEPEATQVFRLEPASTGLIEQLIERRAPHVSQVDRHRIAELSDGNARVALALGNTVRRGEQLGSLSDQDLFHRLFHQRNTVDKELLRAAEICALVYSFDGETTEGDAAELPHLGTLAGLSAEELYRCVDELRGRDLVQRRGRWRAVLPHALANKLAADALSSTPLSSLSNVLEAKAPQRLLVSFSRRLGYLHSSEQAQAIVRKWLSPDGLLGDFSSLSDDALKMLGYVAPVLPNELLSLIERAVRVSGAQLAEGRSWQRSTWVSLLRSIAYDPQHFERAASILADFAGLGSEKAFDNAATEFQELFHIYLSGTHATLDQRIRVAAALINSDRPAAQSLGVSAIDGLLHADHFSSSHDFAFGARPRDFGWQPKDRKEIRDWYVRAIQFAESQVEHPTLGERVRSVLASRFRELWRGSGAWAELDQLCRKIGSQGLWTDGWVAVRSTIRYDANGMPKDILDCLKTLENALRPKAVLESARAFLFAKSWGDLDDLEEEEEDAENSKGKSAVRAYDRANNRAQELGEQVAKDPHVLSILLPEAANKNAQRAWPFGRGLALGAQDAVTMWRDLIAAITLHVDEDRGYAIVCGFLRGTSERDRQLAEAFFDEALKHPILGPQFPYLQVAIDLDERALGRLVTATELRLAPAWAYRYLALGRATDPLPSDGLSELVMRIAEMNDGFPVATEILSMRAHAARDGAPFDAALIYCAQQLLEKCTFEKTDFQNDYNLAKLARHCLVGVEAEGVCRRLCQRLATALGDYRSSAHDYDDLIAVVFQVQPRVAMEEFLLGVDGRAERNLARHFRYVRRKPMFHVPERIVIEWASEDPAVRCPALAAAVPLFEKDDDDDGGSGGWAQVALKLLELAPDKRAFLDIVSSRFMPSGWSGSLANILEDRRKLPQALMGCADAVVASWAREQDEALAKWAEEERQRERKRDERFE